jgi:multidrug efflux pump subunit AcrB
MVQQTSGLLAPEQQIQLHTGVWLRSAEQVGELIVAVRQHNGATKPVYLNDVAEVSLGSSEPQHYVQHWQRNADGSISQSPAVTLYVAKQPGTNAVDVAAALQAKLTQLQQHYIANDIELTVSRNYGETAEDKANTLIQKLVFATISVVVLVGFALGWREAFVVGMAVVITLAMTLFASWAYGFTLNRVSLFALIFSIGILVDDAIVVVENLHRHMLMGKKSLLEAIPYAVEEVGAPTILATFTVIAALLPMAFVSGLMGPYMSPIPLNASMGMLISLLVAFIFTPWLFYRVFIKHQVSSEQAHHDELSGKAESVFRRLMTPFLAARSGRANRLKLLLGLLLLIAGSVVLVVNQSVVLKMLPFDNKSEFQVVVDLPEGATLEQTQAVLNQISSVMLAEPEVTHVQTYAGTAAPINFNGLVRQYYLRQYPWHGDVQVNLAHRLDRDEQSHAIALRVRPALQALEQQTGYSIKLVEVPPGPPVLAPLVAEVYGAHYGQQLAAAERIKTLFAASDHVVDIDSTIEAPQPQWQLHVDQQKAAEYGVSVAAINAAIATAVEGSNAGYLRDPTSYQLIPIEVKLQQADSVSWQALSQVPVVSQNGAVIALSELTYRVDTTRENAIHRKDLRPVVYVTADLAGGVDSPLYGMIDIHGKLSEQQVRQHLIAAPDNTDELSVKWDGEWQITYETFRDMGLAYAVGLIMIYLLVVAQFHSYGVPLIIMAPIPLTLIGIMPGHWLLGAQFTATSMIGMIALAGIIVRNSILLVDYIQQQTALGVKLEDAVIHASAVRARPIILTALAAMMGGFFILDDPIFGGLAVSLIFGILVSTLLTLVVIPVVYYAYNYRKYVS